MSTECTSSKLPFNPLAGRRVEVDFHAGRVSSMGGLVLLRMVAEGMGLFEQFADCFVDHRDPTRVAHALPELLAQRVLSIAAGFEDLNDHDRLRLDPVLAVASGKADPFGTTRSGVPLASPATLNRLELARTEVDPQRRDLKVLHRPEAIESLLVDLFLDEMGAPPAQVVLDVDATNVELHGQQEGTHYHGYYDQYCYLPIYIFCGQHLLTAKLQTSDQGEVPTALAELQRVVRHIRERWPAVPVLVRGDGAYSHDSLMSWCEDDGIDFVLGMPKNSRLNGEVAEDQARMAKVAEESGEPARCYRSFRYKTRKSWSRERRVVAKVEQLADKANPRFVVTSLEDDAKHLYEAVYCARGDAENRIKEQQLGLFADRASSHTKRGNQLRLWFSAIAYVLMEALRRRALRGTKMARAQVWTIREHLLRVGALVKLSVRRVLVSLSSSFPKQDVFRLATTNLRTSFADVF